MRSGFAFSIGVHALILFLLLTQLSFLQPKPPEQPPIVSVELVQVAKQATTNKVSPANRVEKQPEDETPPAPSKPQTSPEPAPQPEQPKPVELEPAPTLKPVDTTAPELDAPPEEVLKQAMAPPPKIAMPDEQAPKLVVPQANIKPHLAPAPALTVPQVEEQVAALAPPAKVDLKRPPAKQQPKNIDSVLNHVLSASALKNLDKTDDQDPDEDTPPQQARTPQHRASGAQAPLSQQLTASDMDAVREQLRRCWHPPASVKDAQNIVVDLDLEISRDRVVTSAVPTEQDRMSDPVFAAAARAAQSALRSPECTPLDLPPEKYSQWQSMTFRFDPKDLL